MDQRTRREQINKFVEHWQNAEGNEEREARSFLIEFLTDVLGIENPTRVLDFERRVKGRMIDAFYEDMGILIEAKSRKPGILDEQRNNGKYGFETPYQQAKWYANELPSLIKPRWIIVTDFDEFRIHDLNLEYPEKEYITVKLDDLPEQAYLFDFFFDKSQSRLVKEKELSVEAGEIVGKLYDAFAKQYLNLEHSKEEQRSLNVLIVRLVFLLYAEDAQLFGEHQAFYKYMQDFNAAQSRQALIDLFKILDTPEDNRDPYAPEKLLAFPYVNGSLFSDESIIVPQFTENLRVELLLNASRGFDWAKISPTIFGAVFESTLNPETRRAGGMHYTSIENIHKVIDPLFLDDLKTELAGIEGEKVERKRKFALLEFQDKLARLNIFDPACGSGNFLTESYIQLRRLENRVLENIQIEGQAAFDLGEDYQQIKVSIKQLYGIEINDFAVSVAKTALWIAESQMLTETQDIVRRYIDYFPLTTNAHIVEGNALRMNWNEVLPASECSYIIGNPPFYGAKLMSSIQKDEIVSLFAKVPLANSLDYVSGWYYKAAEYIQNSEIECAFVSTNSITQGQQVYPLWHTIVSRFGIRIIFAYKTFIWDSEANQKAHVYCVVIGFASKERQRITLFEGDKAADVQEINPYLIPAPWVEITNRSKPICNVAEMALGNSAYDDGAYILDDYERDSLIAEDERIAKFIKPYIGAKEFINGDMRSAIWLADVDKKEYIDIAAIVDRIERVRQFRLNSTAADTRKKAETPELFFRISQPDNNYLIVPLTSSERRTYLPIGYMTPEVIVAKSISFIANADLYTFGIMSSQFHNAWMRIVSGRLKGDYRYSNKIVYNNLIWPNPSPEQRAKIEKLAQSVLDARDAHLDSSLAELYDPDKMPMDLLAAHKALDKAVEEAYGVDFDGNEEKIVAHLFKLYSDVTKDAC